MGRGGTKEIRASVLESKKRGRGGKEAIKEGEKKRKGFCQFLAYIKYRKKKEKK